MCSLCCVSAATAEVYKWTDAAGNVHFSDKPAHAKARAVQLKTPINGFTSTVTREESKQASSASASNKSRKQQARTASASSGNKLKPRIKPGQVVMYSTTWCGYCKKAKAYFRKKGIRFREYDIEKSSKARLEYQALGAGGVPLILIGKQQGFHRLSGFSIARFENHYRK